MKRSQPPITQAADHKDEAAYVVQSETPPAHSGPPRPVLRVTVPPPPPPMPSINDQLDLAALVAASASTLGPSTVDQDVRKEGTAMHPSFSFAAMYAALDELERSPGGKGK